MLSEPNRSLYKLFYPTNDTLLGGYIQYEPSIAKWFLFQEVKLIKLLGKWHIRFVTWTRDTRKENSNVILKNFVDEAQTEPMVPNSVALGLQLRRADRLKRLLPDGSSGVLVVNKALFINFHFSLHNRISLILIPSIYPIVLTRRVDPVPDPILPEKYLGYSRKLNPGPLG